MTYEQMYVVQPYEANKGKHIFQNGNKLRPNGKRQRKTKNMVKGYGEDR
jgi:hypothetical protein